MRSVFFTLVLSLITTIALTIFIDSNSFVEGDVDDSSDYFRVTKDNVSVYDNRSGSLEKVGELTEGEVYPRISSYGNWHRIQFGDYSGYVIKSATEPATGETIRNENHGQYSTTGDELVANKEVPVFDNSSGSLKEFATLEPGAEVTKVSDYGNWWRIVLSDRVGYIWKGSVNHAFSSEDEYFEVTADNVSVYDNRGGSLEKVGELREGEVYPLRSSFGNWHRIQFGDYSGYVVKSATKPATGDAIQNENHGQYSTNGEELVANKKLPVFDNSSGSLEQFATLEPGAEVTKVSDYGSWWRIVLSDRVGYIWKGSVNYVFHPEDEYFEVISDNVSVYDNRSGSLEKVAELTEGEVYPRISSYGNWHRIQFGNYSGYVIKSATKPATGETVKNENEGQYSTNGDVLIAREEVSVFDNSSGSLEQFATLEPGAKVIRSGDYGNWWRIIMSDRVGYVWKDSLGLAGIDYTKYDLSFSRAMEIQMSASTPPKYDGAGQTTADRPNVSYYLNPANFPQGSPGFMQFLLLDQSTNLPASELNNSFLDGAGTLEGTGQAFIEAGDEYGVNELYLMAHALHESGRGTSTLARGVGVDSSGNVIRENGEIVREEDHPDVDHIVYNMYGYGAVDSNPTNGGARYAFNREWFSPSAAVYGGAGQIVSNYISQGQNTLYKMKWDPDYATANNSLGKQYATHIRWAEIQANFLYNMLGENVNDYALRYDVPSYVNQPDADGSVPPPPEEDSDDPEDYVVQSYPSGVVGEVQVSSGNLNFREGPSTNYDRIDSIPLGTEIDILGGNGGNWLFIEYNGDKGWVSRNYVEILNLYVVDSSNGIVYRDAPAGNRSGSIPNESFVVLSLDSNHNIVSQEATLSGTNYTWYRIYRNGDEYWTANNWLDKIE